MSVATGMAVAGVAAAGASAYGSAQQRAAMSEAADMFTPFQMMRRTARVNQTVVPTNLNTELENRQQYDPQFLQHNLDMQRQFAPQQAQAALDVTRQMAPEYLKLQEELLNQQDPNALATRDNLGATILSELRAGRDMTEGQRMRYLDDIRGAQVARGNYTGPSASFDEAFRLSGAGDQLLQQRVGNAANFLANVPGKGQMAAGLPNPFQSVNPAAQGANFRVVDPGDAFRAAGYQASVNNTTAQLAMAPQPNPWLAGLGGLSGTMAGYSAMTKPQGGAMPSSYQPTPTQGFQQNAWAALG
jgi:hypothetical protein